MALIVVTSWLAAVFSLSTIDPFIAIQRLTNATATNESDASRIVNYSVALTDFAKHPLAGNGFDVIRDAHDIYFQLLQGGGLLAFASFGLFAACSLWLGVRLSRHSALTREMQNLASALAASLLVWLLAGLAQNLIYDRYLYLPAGVLIGLRMAARSETVKKRLSGRVQSIVVTDAVGTRRFHEAAGSTDRRRAIDD